MNLDGEDRIPESILQVLVDVFATALPPAALDGLALVLTPTARAPRGNRRSKVRTWLHAVNVDASLRPLDILGRAIAALPVEYLDAPRVGTAGWSNRRWLEAQFGAVGLRFIPPDRIVRSVGRGRPHRG